MLHLLLLRNLTKCSILIFQFLVPQSHEAEYPMFVFCEGRSRDVMTLNRFSISDDAVRCCGVQFESDDDLECEEFEFL